MLVERTLERGQLALRGEPFDRRDARAVCLHRQQHAALDRLPVDVNRAGAAVPRVAAHVRAGQPEVVPDEVHEEPPRGEVVLDRLAVDLHRDRAAGCGRGRTQLFLRSAACMTARTAEISAR